MTLGETLAPGRSVSVEVADTGCGMDEATLEVRGSETELERVPIATNLRHDKLDAVITEASLLGTALLLHLEDG